MKRQIILTALLIAIFISAKAQTDTAIDSLLNQYVLSSTNKNPGILAGVIDCNTGILKTFSKGAIDKGNDLRLVCPGSKPAISYLILKNGLNIQSTIDKWFPLKFDVTNYSESDKTSSFEEMVLPANEFEKLKFDVTIYTTKTELTSPDAIELPVNEFQNLKFDVTKYIINTELTSPDAIELTVNEFENLKFDVNKYTDKDEMKSDNIQELPVDEFNYLKFDVNKYVAHSNMNSDNLEEIL